MQSNLGRTIGYRLLTISCLLNNIDNIYPLYCLGILRKVKKHVLSECKYFNIAKIRVMIQVNYDSSFI